MSRYRVFELDEFTKRLSKLGPSDGEFIRKKLETDLYHRLREEPHFGKNIKKLRGYHPDTWRFRVGRYRVFYTIEEEGKIVFISSVDHRKDAYR